MTDIRYYHLQRQTLEEVLPSLLSKALSGGRRIIVKLADEKHVQSVSDALWTYKPESFLPHGSLADGAEFAPEQPIWITCDDQNPNQADMMIAAGGAFCETPDAYTLYCEMLDGHNQDAIEAARARWKKYKEDGHTLTYWQQTDQGRWEQKS